MNTPCPHCGKAIPVGDDEANCPHCDNRVRFMDVDERPCRTCGKPIPLIPGKTVQCPEGHVEALDGGEVRYVTRCPRCNRKLPAPKEVETLTCRHCGQAMGLQDTL